MSATAFGPKSFHALLLSTLLSLIATTATAQTLVGNVFSDGFENWVATNPTVPTTNGVGTANWGVLLTGDKPLLEGSDGRPGDGVTTAGVADGNWKPYILINDADITPANYTISANMATTDNDGMGIIFGYQNDDNYFRLSLRREAGSNFGYSTGTSIQKVVNGVTTEIFFDNVIDHPNNPFNVQLQVSGKDMTITYPDQPFTHPVQTDQDLLPGKYGVHSWGQKTAAATDPQYGTMVNQMSVTSSTVNRTHNFDNAVVADWRRLDMVNAVGGTSTAGEFQGNFYQDFLNNRIVDDTNGNLAGTDIGGNTRIDFLGPAVVIDEPGNGGWSNYVMSTRLKTNDNDGIGVLFRVASDNSSFYRINFTNEGAGAATSGRPAQGMSMQKFANGTWTEIYSDSGTTPEFIYTPGVPFDLSVIAEGNTFKIGVVNDPDGAVTAINYDPIVDSTGPLLTGSVGFTNWGLGDAGFGAEFSEYGGGGTPLLSATLPELQLTIDRASGEVTLQNTGAEIAIDYYELTSEGNSLNSAVGTGNNQWTPLDLAESDSLGQGWDPAGSPSSAFLAEGRLVDAAVNIGAGASLSLGEAYNSIVNAEDIRFLYRLGNGMFVLGDVEYISSPSIPGDTDGDGDIDLQDLFNVQNNFGLPSPPALGDTDGDSDIDLQDLFNVQNNFGLDPTPGALTSMATSVPEPGTWALASFATLALLRLRRRKVSIDSPQTRQGMPPMRKTLSAALAVAFLACFAGSAQADLVARYLLNNTYNDSSGNGYHGIAWGTPTFENDPTFGDVLRIPDAGDNGVDLDGTIPFPDFPANSSITLMAWYKRTSDPAGEFRYVVNLGQNGDAPIATLGVRASADQITSYIETDQPGGNADQVNTFGTTAIEGGAAAWSSWHHLAVVYDRATDIASVYLDGALDNTNSIAAVRDEYGFSWPRASIGRGPGGSSSSPGYIHDVQIYDHALTQAELIDAIGQPVFEARINRTTGELIVENVSDVAGTFNSYSLISPDGALDPSEWDSVTNNWDMGGAGSIDTNPWAIDSQTNYLFAESETPLVNGGTLAPGQTVNLGTPWIRSTSENMTLEVNLSNGLKATSAVVFEGGINNAPYTRSDLNFDGDVNLADFQLFIDNFGTDFSSITPAQAYVLGDLNLDGQSGASDFATFKNDYDAANGAGAFAAAIGAQVPEPSTMAFVLLVGTATLLLRRRMSSTSVA